MSELRKGEGGAFRLHNKVGASEIEEGRENAAEGRSRLSVALGQRDTQRFSSLVFWLFTAPHFFFFFFVTPHLYALILSVRLTFLLLIPCLPAVSVTLSYI